MSRIKNYKMNLHVLSPVHIGGAEYKSKLTTKEYIYDRRKKILTIIDANKFTDLLIRRNLFDTYIDYIQERVNTSKKEQNRKADIRTFIQQHKLEAQIPSIAAKEYKNLEIDTENGRLNDINLVVKDVYGEPYIPGSSIKGAMVTSLLVDYIISHRNEFKDNISSILKAARKVQSDRDVRDYKKTVSREVATIENLILYGTPRAPKVKRFGLSVSDTYRSENLNTCFLQDIDETMKDGDFKPMPLAREYIAPGSRLFCDISLDFDRFKESRLKVESMDDVFDAIERSALYLTTVCIPYAGKETDLILGANTGFHQKTVVHALFDNEKERLDVVRKLLHKGSKKKITNHLNDKYAPRVINRVIWDTYEELAGVVRLDIVEEE
ncbi:type III-A CRISPR-associated RAMP protein Csm5 [Filifactor villosus]|uniref:CRISPR system Cms protein Csm5 n=1 Tax=Filifactor villosus TaxID=29374 RepID=A0ABV9QIY0_9FIRM